MGNSFPSEEVDDETIEEESHDKNYYLKKYGEPTETIMLYRLESDIESIKDYKEETFLTHARREGNWLGCKDGSPHEKNYIKRSIWHKKDQSYYYLAMYETAEEDVKIFYYKENL